MKRVLGIIIIFFLFASCGKEENFVPDYPVRYDVTLQEFGIYAKNNVLLVPNYGVAGLMIVRTPTGAYVAFDRCSTVNPEKACAVIPDDSGITATDPCSDGKFLLLDGSPQKWPAERSLKKYSVVIAGGNLSVRN
ncbi:Rieske (2Fe-2S) protein [Pedobacter montanisoli]|uniref:Rieske domain-containing protein n=1 Tax=Pedobacter montanisoli TaxID=2923277 RepID=A0ABS9ZRC8_9SPHI|nr:hypothetical protein [Pedobacter montanisoli]MCJ0741155.1 hypothetical protein [Pedobacter montanisoli]